MKFRHVSPAILSDVWPKVEPQIARALSHGQGDQTNTSVFYSQIMRGAMQLWVMIDDEEIIASCVLSVIDYPDTKKLWVETLSGDGFDEWGDELEELLLDYMNIMGADCIEASCRPGLAKNLQRRRTGWRKKAIIMELKNG